MKIEINEKGPRAYYDEITYIKQNFSRVLKNPGKPARTHTSYIMIRVIGFVIVVTAAVYLYRSTGDILYGIMSLAMLVALAAVGMSLVTGLKKMKTLKEEDGSRVIEVTEEGISCTENGKVNYLSWDNILCIAINKHSVAVLPKETAFYGIYAPISYKDQMIQAIREAGHFYMIEDNIGALD